MNDLLQIHIERQAIEYQALSEVVALLKYRKPLSETLELSLGIIVQVIPQADFGVVMLWDQSSGLFRPWASYGCDAEIIRKIGLQAGESITGRVHDDQESLLLDTPDKVAQAMANMRLANRDLFAKAIKREANPLCTIAAPIATDKQKFGVLVLETSLADLIAFAIETSRLEARADAIRQSRETERLRSEALATLSHELRMPLTTIKGYTTMLLMDEIEWDSEKINEYLQLIDEECDSMQAMIKSILDSSMIDANQIPVEPQPLRLGIIARDVAGEVQHRTERHRLIVDFPKDFPMVNVDPRWIKQVFRNILDNAVKYSPNGGLIVIRGEARKTDIVVSIADQGIGISPEDLIPLFERYYRVRSVHTMNVPGTGLGLPIARSIVEMHGGRIWADSQLGQGSTIYFSLPVFKPATGPLSQEQPPEQELPDFDEQHRENQ
jgi:signal transduction histidine kinase